MFQTTKQNIAKHLKAIFVEGELDEDSVVNFWLTTAADALVEWRNLDATVREHPIIHRKIQPASPFSMGDAPL